MIADIRNVTDSTFEREVLGAARPVMVDFWAPWCGPCRMVAPRFEELASKHAADARFVKVNVDQSPQTASRYGIQSIPTMMIFSQGQKVGELIGLQSVAAMENKLRQALASSGANSSLILACARCGQKNRVPASRRSEAICGRCHASLGVES